MKNWNEVKDGLTVYIRDPIEFEDENGKIQKTKPYQKANVSAVLSNDECVVVTVSGGIADDSDFYFYSKSASPEELLSIGEYKDIRKKKFEFSEGNKVCPKCEYIITPEMKYAYKKEWCPNCGYGIVE